MVLVPAALMVSTIRFRSFKTIDSKARRPYTVLIFVAAGIVAIATHPQWTLVAIAYSYLASAFVGMAITRFKHRGAAAADRRKTIRRRSTQTAPPLAPLRSCSAKAYERRIVDRRRLSPRYVVIAHDRPCLIPG